MPNLITMTNIKKTYDGSKNILNDFNFSLNKGDIALVMGPSGCGKSTFLNILGLLDSYSEGEYVFNGDLIKNEKVKKSYSQYRGSKIGFIFQAYYLIDALSVKENIMMPFLYSNSKLPINIDQKIDEYLDYFNLAPLKNQKAMLLSGGERQRVAIIRAMIKNPELLIADEPTGNLDEKNASIVINAFRKIAQNGTAIVFVTHNPNIYCPESIRYRLEEGKLHNVE